MISLTGVDAVWSVCYRNACTCDATDQRQGIWVLSIRKIHVVGGLWYQKMDQASRSATRSSPQHCILSPVDQRAYHIKDMILDCETEGDTAASR